MIRVVKDGIKDAQEGEGRVEMRVKNIFLSFRGQEHTRGLEARAVELPAMVYY